MPDKYVRRLDRCRRQQPMEVVDRIFTRAGSIARIAEAEASSVIGACLCDGSDGRLHRRPRSKLIAKTGFEYHGGRTVADAVNIQAPSADVYQTIRCDIGKIADDWGWRCIGKASTGD